MLRRGRKAGTAGMLGAAGALVTVALLSVAGAKADEKQGPFDAARLVPGDVGLFLHVENARDIRVDIARRPLARAAERMLGEGEVAEAWQREKIPWRRLAGQRVFAFYSTVLKWIQ